MNRIYTAEIGMHVGERVHLAEWLHTLRRMGSINFLVLRDARGTAQIVVDTPEALHALQGVLPESVLAVEGTVVAEEQAPGGVELRNPACEVESSEVCQTSELWTYFFIPTTIRCALTPSSAGSASTARAICSRRWRNSASAHQASKSGNSQAGPSTP